MQEAVVVALLLVANGRSSQRVLVSQIPTEGEEMKEILGKIRQGTQKRHINSQKDTLTPQKGLLNGVSIQWVTFLSPNGSISNVTS